MSVAVAFAVGLVIGMQVHGSQDAAPTPPGSPSPTTSPRSGLATNVLIHSGQSESTTSNEPVGTATFSTYLTNTGDQPLIPAGPVQLLGPNGPVAHVTVVIARPEGGQSQPLSGLPPLSIAANGGKVTVRVVASYDCHRDREEAAWSNTYPRVVIPLQGYEQPAAYSFSDLYAGGSFYSQLCGSTGFPTSSSS